MPLRVFIAMVIVAMASFALVVWNMSSDPTRPPVSSGGAPPAGQATPGDPAQGEPVTPAADPGVTWDVPGPWTIDLAQGMRLATYLVRGSGDAEPAECAVYYFGPGQGGGVDANLERWKGEFQPLDQHAVEKRKPGGIEITRIVARGTYVAHSMRGQGTAGERPRWVLLGAIARGPSGDVFFKLTGPAATVDAAAPEFDHMLDSMRKK